MPLGFKNIIIIVKRIPTADQLSEIMTNNNIDILRELDDSELNVLVTLYRRHLPYAFATYCLIKNQLHWNRIISKLTNNEKQIQVSGRVMSKFYTHRNGDLKRNGTCVGISLEGVSFVAQFFPNNFFNLVSYEIPYILTRIIM